MIKRLVLYFIAVVAIVYFGLVGYVYYFDTHRTNPFPADGLSAENQPIQKIFNSYGCSYCHTPGAELPSYASWPIAKQLMEHDVKNGTAYFYLTAIEKSLKANEPAPEADLAKIEAVMLDRSMPPKLYKLMHWTGFIGDNDRHTLLTWVKSQREAYYSTPNAAPDMRGEPIQPLPDSIPYDTKQALLGEKLYYDTRLSGDNTLSCATCHDLNKGGVDGLPTSTGIEGQKGPINAPTVFNAVFNHAQFWNARAANLQEQAGGPPLNPIEMGSKSWDEIIDRLNQDAAFKKQFSAVYEEGFTAATITAAIAEFEKTLITPSPFDAYLKGNKAAISEQQLHGYKLFKENRCSTCHVGINLGGQSNEPLGLAQTFFGDHLSATEQDLGLFTVTNEERDRFRQKVPGLRNLSSTGPYFHRGDVKTLDEAVRMMLKYQVGRNLSDNDVADIIAFLKSLDGKYERDLPPALR